jgi:hypothetical protein
MARVQRKWRVPSENGAGPVKMARVKSSEPRVTSSINCPVLIFKMADILTKNSAINIQSNIVSFCGNSASFKLKLTDIN